MKFNYGIEYKKARVDGCKTGFLKFAEFGKSKFQDVRKEIVNGQLVHASAKRPTSKSTPSDAIVHDMAKDLEAMGSEWVPDFAGIIRSPEINNRRGVAFAWLKQHLSEIASDQPNQKGYKHFQNSRTWQDIWKDYQKEVKHRNDGSPLLGYKGFRKMAKQQFPAYRPQATCGVEGKCPTCGFLNDGRDKAKPGLQRIALAKLHYFHRQMYRSERLLYYARRDRAIAFPEHFVSTIIDGMSQSHNKIPYGGPAGGSSVAHSVFETHIEGTIIHGIKVKLLRSFGNMTGKVSTCY